MPTTLSLMFGEEQVSNGPSNVSAALVSTRHVLDSCKPTFAGSVLGSKSPPLLSFFPLLILCSCPTQLVVELMFGLIYNSTSFPHDLVLVLPLAHFKNLGICFG